MRKIAGLLTSVAMTLGLLLVGTPDANAVWQCRSWSQWPIYGYASCDYGAGGVRVVGDCWYAYDGHLETFWGPWVSAGRTSQMICQGSYIARTWYETF